MTSSSQVKALIAVLALATSLLVAGVAYSHDVWLLPDQFHIARGRTLTLRQFSGIELENADEVELFRQSTPVFRLITPDDTIDLLEELPDMSTQPVVMPVLERALDFDGLALVTMEHAFIHTAFPADKFVEYLEHEEYNVDDFKDRLAGRKFELERYARTLKTLIQVGDSLEGNVSGRVLGQRIEIILLQNPYSLAVGDKLEARVLFDGEPLQDRAVMAFSQTAGGVVTKTIARTDENGVAAFTLDRKGVWLLRLVHLRPCEEPGDDPCDSAGWESFWASFTFSFG